MKLTEAITLITNPIFIEPPMGRRKARIECFAAGCERPVIVTRWICMECWRKLPLRLRKANNQAYRKFQDYKKMGMQDGMQYTRTRWMKVAARAIKWTYDNLEKK